MSVRNVAIIAHVDHGKTTLVDAVLKQSHIFRANQMEMHQEQILDRNELERERGITILAKSCSVDYNDTTINIIDTPGHADFSGEVERTLGMADGAILVVDAQEGPMPQTRFVLKKALDLHLKLILVVNKIDKAFADPARTVSKVEDLFLELAANEDQLHFPILYAISREGKVWTELPADSQAPADVGPLLATIVSHVPAPDAPKDAVGKMVVTSLDWDPHLGRMALGKIAQGTLKTGQLVKILSDTPTDRQISKLMKMHGLERREVAEAEAGDVVWISGLDGVRIGQTVTDPSDTSSLPGVEVSEPTLKITLGPNTSPFSGKEGSYSTSRQLEERLNRELETNLSLRVDKKASGSFSISGRGELHLSVLLETMRREGYEFEVGKPEAIIRIIDGVNQEPQEEVTVIVPEAYTGVVSQEFGKRFAEMQSMQPLSSGEVSYVFRAPARVLIGLRSLLLTATRGTVVYSSVGIGWQPLGKSIPKLRRGALIAGETGEATAYGLEIAQGRGATLVDPGTRVYEGMIVGFNSRDEDITINVTKGKKLTNMRSKSSDGVIQLAPKLDLSLEQSLDILEPDEVLEVTPISLRLRKRHLTDNDRRRFARENRQV